MSSTPPLPPGGPPRSRAPSAQAADAGAEPLAHRRSTGAGERLPPAAPLSSPPSVVSATSEGVSSIVNAIAAAMDKVTTFLFPSLAETDAASPRDAVIRHAASAPLTGPSSLHAVVAGTQPRPRGPSATAAERPRAGSLSLPDRDVPAASAPPTRKGEGKAAAASASSSPPLPTVLELTIDGAVVPEQLKAFLAAGAVRVEQPSGSSAFSLYMPRLEKGGVLVLPAPIVQRPRVAFAPGRGVAASLRRTADGADLSPGPTFVLSSATADILTPAHLCALRNALPAQLRGYEWVKAYSLLAHGSSLMTVLHRVKSFKTTLVVIKDKNGAVFGGLATEAWTAGVGAGAGPGGSGSSSFSASLRTLQAPGVASVSSSSSGSATSSFGGIMPHPSRYFGAGHCWVFTFEPRRAWDEARPGKLAEPEPPSPGTPLPIDEPGKEEDRDDGIEEDDAARGREGAGGGDGSGSSSGGAAADGSASPASRPPRFLSVYKSTSRNRYYQIVCPGEGWGMGGGGAFAWFLDDSLEHGVSGVCGTFVSPCLAASKRFSAVDVEVWGFQPPGTAPPTE